MHYWATKTVEQCITKMKRNSIKDNTVTISLGWVNQIKSEAWRLAVISLRDLDASRLTPPPPPCVVSFHTMNTAAALPVQFTDQKESARLKYSLSPYRIIRIA